MEIMSKARYLFSCRTVQGSPRTVGNVVRLASNEFNHTNEPALLLGDLFLAKENCCHGAEAGFLVKD